jgi:hypothetical protein
LQSGCKLCHWQPGLFRVLGPFDPFGATANGLHNGIYFRAASRTQNVEVLALWIILPLIVLVALGYQAQRRIIQRRASLPPDSRRPAELIA